MFEDYYVKPSTIDRVRSSWLAPQIESYLECLQGNRYSRLVVYRRLPLLFHFAEFAQEEGCRDIASCKAYIKEFVSQWLEQHGAAVAMRKHAIDPECGVRQMLQLACKEPVTRNRRRRQLPWSGTNRQGVSADYVQVAAFCRPTAGIRSCAGSASGRDRFSLSVHEG